MGEKLLTYFLVEDGFMLDFTMAKSQNEADHLAPIGNFGGWVQSDSAKTRNAGRSLDADRGRDVQADDGFKRYHLP